MWWTNSLGSFLSKYLPNSQLQIIIYLFSFHKEIAFWGKVTKYEFNHTIGFLEPVALWYAGEELSACFLFVTQNIKDMLNGWDVIRWTVCNPHLNEASLCVYVIVWLWSSFVVCLSIWRTKITKPIGSQNVLVLYCPMQQPRAISHR